MTACPSDATSTNPHKRAAVRFGWKSVRVTEGKRGEGEEGVRVEEKRQGCAL